jgi:uncharacterized protein (DUF1778 family)
MRRSINHQDDRLDLRLSPEAKSMLQRAADVERKSLSAFLLDQAILAAAEFLSERTQFRLGATEFDAFCAALEAPMKDRRRLTRLLTTAGALG